MRGDGKKDDIPPNSRIFILHSKSIEKDNIEESFKKFGRVEDVWMVRDRKTGESKGVTYIKYSKMSEAAAAVEEMNGHTPPNETRPLKVVIASSRDEGSKKDDDIEKYLRLFIIIPKDNSVNEDDLKLHFSQFGPVEVMILRDRTSNASKGFAYIKYKKMTEAAKALEECDACYKAVLAKPKNNSDSKESNARGGGRSDRDRNDHRSDSFTNSRNEEHEPRPYSSRSSLYHREGPKRIIAYVSITLTEEMGARLFGLVPGLQFARMSDEPVSHRTQKMFLEYDSAESASWAAEHFHKFEYPPGEPIAMKLESSGGIEPSMSSMAPSTSRKREFGGRGNSTSKIPDDPNFPPARYLEANESNNYRLFVVSQPDPIPTGMVRDIFSKFGHLDNAYLIPGKNFGYVQYTSLDSANNAIYELHGEEVCGNRLKVMEADPPSNKKGRFD